MDNLCSFPGFLLFSREFASTVILQDGENDRRDPVSVVLEVAVSEERSQQWASHGRSQYVH